MSETPTLSFEERLVTVGNTLRRWIVRSFGYDFPVTDDCLQAAYIGLWKAYCKEPDRLDQASDALWVTLGRYAIWNYLHTADFQVCRKCSNGGRRRAVQVIFAESELANSADADSSDQVEDLLSTLSAEKRHSPHTRSRENAEIHEADQRLELERVLKVGFAALDKRYHANMRKLMLDIMLGYSLVESKERHGWTGSQSARLMRLMRNVFREAATGEKVPAHSYRGCKPIGTAEEAHRIQELRAQGLSYAKIGAAIGRSPAFVQHKMKPSVPRDPVKAQRIHELRQQGLSFAKIGQAVGCSKGHVQHVLSLARLG